MPAPLCSAERLRVRLNGRPVLHGLSFDLARGHWIGLVGPNGSGKTTLLRTLAGLLPHEGRLELDGQPVRAYPPRERARRIAFVRQSPDLSFEFRVAEYVLLGRAPHRGWLEGFTKADRARAAEALAAVGLEGFEDRTMNALSGGEQQRVQLAQALAQEPDVLLLDEPTAHLDVHHQFEIMDRVAAEVEGGRTAIAAFHDLAFAARYADRLLVLHDGRLAADGPPPQVLTPDLLRTVFRMDAEVTAGPAGRLEIRYLQPV